MDATLHIKISGTSEVNRVITYPPNITDEERMTAAIKNLDEFLLKCKEKARLIGIDF